MAKRVANELEKLAKLHDLGKINDEQFEAAKAAALRTEVEVANLRGRRARATPQVGAEGTDEPPQPASVPPPAPPRRPSSTAGRRPGGSPSTPTLSAGGSPAPERAEPDAERTPPPKGAGLPVWSVLAVVWFLAVCIYVLLPLLDDWLATYP